jgi:hypothetical protein
VCQVAAIPVHYGMEVLEGMSLSLEKVSDVKFLPAGRNCCLLVMQMITLALMAT